MTVLTWRDVATPDFRGINDGFQASAELMQSGMGALRGAIDNIKQDKVQGQSTALLAEIAQYQDDPAKLKAALPTILGKYDPRYLDKATLETVMKRPDALLEQATKQSAFDEVQKGIKESDYIRDIAPIINGYKTASRQGEQARLAYLETHKDKLNNLSAGAFQKLVNDELEITEGDLKNRGTQLNQLIQGTNFKHSEEDRAVDLEASRLDGFLTGQVAPENRVRFINTNRKALKEKEGFSDRAIDRILRDAAGGSGPGGGSGAASGAGGGGTPNDNIYDVVLGNGQFGQPPKPLTQMTIGEVIDFGKNVLIPNSKAAGVGRDSRGLLGSSASGAYQITQSTLIDYAPKVLGAGWQNQAFTPEVQDKIAEAIFNDNKNGNLKATWASLPDARPGAYAGKSWAEMRDIITQGESGGVANPRGLQIAGNTVNAANIAYSDTADIARTFSELAGDKRTAREVAIGLKGKGGAYEGRDDMDLDHLTQKINKVARESGINPAMAGFALTKSDNGKQSIVKRAGDFLPWADGLPIDWDSDRLNELVNIAKDPKALADGTVKVDEATRAIAQNRQAQAQVDALVAERTRIIQNAENRGIPADTSLIDRRLAEALSVRNGAARTGAATAAAGQQGRTGQDGKIDPAPAQRRRTAPLAKGPAPSKAPIVLAEVAKANANAPWVKKALAAAAAQNKDLTPAEFATLMKKSGKSILTR